MFGPFLSNPRLWQRLFPVPRTFNIVGRCPHTVRELRTCGPPLSSIGETHAVEPLGKRGSESWLPAHFRPRVDHGSTSDGHAVAFPSSLILMCNYLADTEPPLDPCASQERIYWSVNVRFRPHGFDTTGKTTDRDDRHGRTLLQVSFDVKNVDIDQPVL